MNSKLQAAFRNKITHNPYSHSMLTRDHSLTSHSSPKSSDLPSALDYLDPLLRVVSHEISQRKSQTPTPRRRHVTNLAPEEKRQRRLMRNRVAAKECRKKKKEQAEEKEARFKMLVQQNQQLREQVQELQVKLTLGLMLVQNTQGHSFSLKSLDFSLPPPPSSKI